MSCTEHFGLWMEEGAFWTQATCVSSRPDAGEMLICLECSMHVLVLGSPLKLCGFPSAVSSRVSLGMDTFYGGFGI